MIPRTCYGSEAWRFAGLNAGLCPFLLAECLPQVRVYVKNRNAGTRKALADAEWVKAKFTLEPHIPFVINAGQYLDQPGGAGFRL